MYNMTTTHARSWDNVAPTPNTTLPPVAETEADPAVDATADAEPTEEEATP